MTRPPQTLVDDLVAIHQWSQRPQNDIAEVDTINVIVGDGVNVLTPGVAAAIRADFRARVSGCFLQEFDGVTGSINVGIEKAQSGPTPSFTSIIGTTPLTIVAGRYAEVTDLSGWTTYIERGDVLRFLILSAANIRRILIIVRIRRLEP